MNDCTAIAVISMSGCFPGAVDLDAFWKNINGRIASSREIPSVRWRTDPQWVSSGTAVEDRTYSRRACLIETELGDFPLIEEHLGYPATIDPLNAFSFHCAQVALKNILSSNQDRRRIGIILAAIALPTDLASELAGKMFKHCLFGFDPTCGVGTRQLPISAIEAINNRVVSSPAALIANVFGLGGSVYTLDAACASSLYALKLACDELLSFKADIMLAGGVSAADNLYTQIGFSQLRALSPSGRCSPFDLGADGLVVGEGAGIVALKRLSDALRDNDRIFGVIRGIGLSNDMRGNLLAPESAGQLRAMRSAYRTAQWRPEDIDFIECHGAGTRVGDATELSSLMDLWRDRPWTAGQCALGAVKSMIGHLLTGAGAAGLIKTLLALHHKTLPPTMNFDRAPDDSPLHNGPFRVQTHSAPWPARDPDTPRRAAVSAFGFGGINAHVLVEEWRHEKLKDRFHQYNLPIGAPDETPGKKIPSESGTEPIAVVGLDVHVGALASSGAFREAVFNGRSVLQDPQPTRWKMPQTLREWLQVEKIRGAFIDHLAIPIGQFRIPPGEIPDILPQQLLMLKTASGAMRDAGLDVNVPHERMGAVIGIGFDYESTNFHLRWSLPELVRGWRQCNSLIAESPQLSQWMDKTREAIGPGLTATRTLGALGGIVASRIAREFRFGAPSFVVSAEEASGLRAVEIAASLLRQGQADVMLVGAVDLFCDERNLMTVYTRLPLSRKGLVRPFDKQADGTLPGEGAGAFVLKRLSDALADGDRVYAVISGIGCSAGGGFAPREPDASVYRTSLNEALEQAGTTTDRIGLIETHGSGVPAEDDAETAALHACFAPVGCEPVPRVAVGTLRPLIGHTGAATGFLSMAKTVLSLYHQFLPPAVNTEMPRSPAWGTGPFYFPRDPAFWVRNRSDGPRSACVATMTSDGGCMHVILEELEKQPARATARVQSERRRPMGSLSHGLFLIRAAGQQSLLIALDNFERFVQRNLDPGSTESCVPEIEHLARRWYLHGLAQPYSPGSRTLAIVSGSCEHLLACVSRAKQAVAQDQILMPDRSGGLVYFPRPDAVSGNIAFVYPGSGNHMLGMGRTIGIHWPEILRSMDAATDRLRSQMLPHLYQPWRSDWPAQWQAQAHQKLISDPLHTIFGQVVFAGQMTALLREFKIGPKGLIGYSLGESAGLFATGAWPDRSVMLDRLAASELFKTQLTGRYEAVRKAWDIPEDQSVVWKVAVVNRPSQEIDQALQKFRHVRRLIVNTPDECVIGGLQDQVEAVIASLNCEAVYLDGVVSVHCDALQPVAQKYFDLHRFETTAPANLRVYSCAWAKSYKLDSENAARSIVDQAMHGFDFPATIRQAYKDGFTVFLEVGPHGSCTRMIRRILQDEAHLAVNAHARGEDESLVLLKCLAHLAAAGHDIEVAPLYSAAIKEEQTSFAPALKTIRVPVGAGPFALAPPPALPAALPAEDQEDRSSQDTTTIDRPRDFAAPAAGVTDQCAVPPFSSMLEEFDRTVCHTTHAHETFLKLSREWTARYGQTLILQNQILAAMSASGAPLPVSATAKGLPATQTDDGMQVRESGKPVMFTRAQCLEFAVGAVGKLLGPAFDVIDTYKARVRLPDEPLMLVDRILLVEGQKGSLGAGRVVTEHDVLPQAWYLDGGCAPVCISVEAGQADLFLSSYLGIDHRVKGERTYRLLDARIVFHRGLPHPGDTIRYDIHIDKFVKQGETYLFFFRFEGHIGAEHLITMTNGCAGFFTEQEVRASGGILLTEEDRAPGAHLDAVLFQPLVSQSRMALDSDRIEALRRGDAGACFGGAFENVVLPEPLRLPSGRMRLIDRILDLDASGGAWNLGFIKAEADIHPDDWFLTCHFVDDKVMPGTLMYECCAHTLRVLLLRLGWITSTDAVCYEPVPGVPCRLKCRGPVTPGTRKVHYAVEIKQIGYRPEPFVIADAHMHADGRYIVFFKDMSLQLSGVGREELEAFWCKRTAGAGHAGESGRDDNPRPLFTRRHILEFAVGRPSLAFGEPYRIFDDDRIMARLPGPPYSFVDRITLIEPAPWVLKPDGWIEAEYDIPAGEWYFAADRSGIMPFCVLLEIALQPCGWLAAYMGSALRSNQDLKFRNLGGKARQYANIHASQGGQVRLTMRTRATKIAEAADMIIEHFDFEVSSSGRMVYEGDTYFGFFTTQALEKQVGLREAPLSVPSGDAMPISQAVLKDEAPIHPDEVHRDAVFQASGLSLPAKALRMIDRIEAFIPTGGPAGLGYIRAVKDVDPGEWFFKAHFYQDPVCPGSLGVESFLQAVKLAALQFWPELGPTHRFEMLCGNEHRWTYRGQVLPTHQRVTVEAVITRIEKQPVPQILANGWLHVDGLPIYKLENFGLRLINLDASLR